MKYSNEELREIMSNKREAGRDPRKLFIAAVLDSLTYYLDYDEGDEGNEQDVIEKTFRTEDVNRVLNDCLADFINAMKNDLQVEIGWCGYTIRNADKTSREEIESIFEYDKNSEYVTICGDLVNKTDMREVCELSSISKDKTMAQKIYYEGGTDEGWDRLTEYERMIFCWIKYARRIESYGRKAILEDCMTGFMEQYRRYFRVNKRTIRSLANKSYGISYYCFSAELVEKANIMAGMKSNLANVNAEKAADNWYAKIG